MKKVAASKRRVKIEPPDLMTINMGSNTTEPVFVVFRTTKTERDQTRSNFFKKKIFQEHCQIDKQFGSRSGLMWTDVMSVLIWV